MICSSSEITLFRNNTFKAIAISYLWSKKFVTDICIRATLLTCICKTNNNRKGLDLFTVYKYRDLITCSIKDFPNMDSLHPRSISGHLSAPTQKSTIKKNLEVSNIANDKFWKCCLWPPDDELGSSAAGFQWLVPVCQNCSHLPFLWGTISRRLVVLSDRM